MTIPSNVTFSKNGSRLTTRCTAENGDKITITYFTNSGSLTCKVNGEVPSDLGMLREDNFATYLRGLALWGRITMTKAESMIHALDDADIRSEPGMVHGEIKIVEGSPLVIYRGYDDPYAP